MFEQVVAALEAGDLIQARQLLSRWRQQSRRDPWQWLAIGRYQEAKQQWAAAETTYRRLLQQAQQPRLVAQVRQGLARVQRALAQMQQQALEQARQQPGSHEAALLVLEPSQGQARQGAIEGLAQVMRLDAYSARLRLSNQAWRIFRVGPAGDMLYYSQALRQQQTPAFVIRLSDIQAVQVFQVNYWQALSPQATVVCQNAAQQLGQISFDWTEVQQQVIGLLPVYESVVDLDPRGRLRRKQSTQDYAEVIDLHLQHRQCILRICDRTYQFRRGTDTPATALPELTTSRMQWNQLRQELAQRITGPCWKDFAKFGDNALEYIDLLPTFNPNLHIPGAGNDSWSAAFHLYSSLHFLHHR